MAESRSPIAREIVLQIKTIHCVNYLLPIKRQMSTCNGHSISFRYFYTMVRRCLLFLNFYKLCYLTVIVKLDTTTGLYLGHSY